MALDAPSKNRQQGRFGKRASKQTFHFLDQGLTGLGAAPIKRGRIKQTFTQNQAYIGNAEPPLARFFKFVQQHEKHALTVVQLGGFFLLLQLFALLAHFVFELAWLPNPWPLLVLLALAVGGVMLGGWLGTRKLLARPPLASLRALA